MFNKIMLIVIAIMLGFISFLLNNISHDISEEINKKSQMQTSNTAKLKDFNSNIPQEEPVDIQINKTLNIQTSSTAEPVKDSEAKPNIWKDIQNENIKKIVLNYNDKDLVTATQISRFIETTGNEISLFLNYQSNNNQEIITEKQKALKHMDVLLVLLDSNDKINLQANQDYQIALERKIPIILLSTFPINTEALSKFDNIIQVSLDGKGSLQDDILQMLNKMKNAKPEPEDILKTQF